MENTVRWIDYIPLALFIWGGRILHFSFPYISTLHYRFFIGSVSALLCIGYLWLREQSFDYIALGTYLFLFGGAFEALTYNSPGDFSLLLTQASLFAWIFLVGTFAAFFTPEGFCKVIKKPLYAKGFCNAPYSNPWDSWSLLLLA